MLLKAKEIYSTRFFKSLKPVKRMLVSDWADKYRILSQTSSAEAGTWRTSRTPYLKEIMDVLSPHTDVEKVVFMKSAQIGGALSLDTPIPTVDGWTTMGEIKVGDTIFDENGSQCKVKFKSEVFNDHECYEITFSDKTKIVCDHVHRWNVIDKRTNSDKTLYTPEIYETQSFRDRNRYSILNCSPLEIKEKKLPINSYQLGVWLGDGGRHTGQLYLNREDSREILKFFENYKIRDNSENCVNVLIEDFCTKLRIAGLLKTKKIPQEYLRASKEQRISLLQGLMDTDGSITKFGRCEFSSRDESLAVGVYELLVSLGIKPSFTSFRTRRGFKGKELATERTQFRIDFTTFDICPFRLKRKIKRLPVNGRRLETIQRYISNVKKIDTVKTACIEVDSPSHLYLCGKQMVPTHNTECGNNWIGYVIDHCPGPMMFVQPTDLTVKKYVKIRIDPFIEENPRLKSRVAEKKSRDSGNTQFLKMFPGGYLTFAGANSPSQLRSLPIRFLFMDEVDAYPGDCGGEGDPTILASKRTNTFAGRKKIFLNSTPLDESTSRISAAYEDSDQRKYYVPCPDCGEYQSLKFNNLKWDAGSYETVRYACDHCGVLIPEHKKSYMLGHGKWVAENPDYKNGRIAGFHINALYSPLGWFSWQEIAEEFEEAKKSREKLKSFVNTVLGETWKDKGDAPEWERIFDRRETYEINTVPEGVVFLTAAVDVQKDRLECEIKGWGRNKQSWSIDFRVFLGDTAAEEVWVNLDNVLAETWKKGYKDMPIKLMVIDSGFNTQHVYNYCRKYQANRVRPIKGSDTMSTILGTPRRIDINWKGTKIKKGVNLWSIGVSVLKSETYGFLKQNKPTEKEDPFPLGYCHFPQYDAEYFKQLTAEQLIVRMVKGRRKYEWEKTRDRNEALDCHVYNRAAASMVGIDRFGEQEWSLLENTFVESVKKVENNTEKVNKKPKKKRKSNFW